MRLRAVAFVLFLPAFLQAQTITASAVAGSTLTALAPGGTGASAALGTPMPSGFQVTDSTPQGLAFLRATLVQQPTGITYTLTDSSSIPSVTGRCATGPHQTLLTVNVPQPMLVRITATWRTPAYNNGNLIPTWIDIGNDGSIEWNDNWSAAPHPTFTTIVPVTGSQLQIRTQTGSESLVFSGSIVILRWTGRSDLEIHVDPVVPVLSANVRTTGVGEPFPEPVMARILDVGGAPVINTPVTFSITGPGTFSGPSVVNTDASGIAMVPVLGGPSSGVVNVTATVAGMQLPGIDLYVDQLSLTRNPASVLLGITNPAPTASPVAYALLTSPPGIPPLATIIGPIATNPNDPATIVLEDSIGLFGFPSLSGTGCVGTPASVSKLYAIPPGFLAGVTLQFQAIGLDPVRGFFRTNAALLTF